jgi:hypothetical protein
MEWAAPPLNTSRIQYFANAMRIATIRTYAPQIRVRKIDANMSSTMAMVMVSRVGLARAVTTVTIKTRT